VTANHPVGAGGGNAWSAGLLALAVSEC
jgi:hypothetical protein